MANFTDLSGKQQLGILAALALMVTAAVYYTALRPMIDSNKATRETLESKKAENAQLEPFVSKKSEMEATLVGLRGQLDTLNRIVPSEKEASDFMRMLQAEAADAGIEVRRYTARPTTAKEFFSEVPFDIEVDGAYYALLRFFNRVGSLERIINVSALRMASVRKPSDAGVKKTYQYAPNESVVVSCVATTYFSREVSATPAATVIASK